MGEEIAEKKKRAREISMRSAKEARRIMRRSEKLVMRIAIECNWFRSMPLEACIELVGAQAPPSVVKKVYSTCHGPGETPQPRDKAMEKAQERKKEAEKIRARAVKWSRINAYLRKLRDAREQANRKRQQQEKNKEKQDRIDIVQHELKNAIEAKRNKVDRTGRTISCGQCDHCGKYVSLKNRDGPQTLWRHRDNDGGLCPGCGKTDFTLAM